MNDIQSKLSVSNITQELFSSFAARWASNYSLFFSFTTPPFSHGAIMQMEIDFLLENITEKSSELLTDYIKSVESGASPFFPTTLSLVYDGLVGKSFPNRYPLTSGPRTFPSGQGVTIPTPSNDQFGP